MREIKFRVWDKKYNSYSEEPYYRLLLSKNGQVYNSENDEWHKIDGRYVIQQFTGLTDKNGKEIYEGDIVESEKWVSIGKYERCIGIIEYQYCSFTIDCIKEWSGSNAVLNGNATVIGNIYENPNLLNP
jgi:uncharacterized phage protein (TIGR01671 family)